MLDGSDIPVLIQENTRISEHAVCMIILCGIQGKFRIGIL